MANTYTQIHIQTVFAVKYRAAVLEKAWREELFRYMTGIIKKFDHKLLAINGVEDHVHAFFGMRPTQSLSDLMQVVKGESSEWINKRGFTGQNFEWQGGYGAFSYSKSHVDRVIGYVRNQEEHHRQIKFLDEYHRMLMEHGIDYNEQYIFKEMV